MNALADFPATIYEQRTVERQAAQKALRAELQSLPCNERLARIRERLAARQTAARP